MTEFTVLCADLGFTEGPVHLADGRRVVASIDRGLLYEVVSGGARVLAHTAVGPNGVTEGEAGRLYVALNGGGPPATRTKEVTGGIQVVDAHTGAVEWLTRDPIWPNDLCFGPDGLLYVTDPTRRKARDDGRLWRIDPHSGESELLGSVPWFPNGIGFGLEEDVLYAASTGTSSIMRAELRDGTLGPWVEHLTMAVGMPDGFAFDQDGNMVIAALSPTDEPGSVQVWSPEGDLLELLRPGRSRLYTNLSISEDELMLCDATTGTVLTAPWPSAGLPLFPHRRG